MINVFKKPAAPASAGGVSITSALILNIALLTAVVGALCAWLLTLWGAEEIQRREQDRLASAAHSSLSFVSERSGRVASARMSPVFTSMTTAAPRMGGCTER